MDGTVGMEALTQGLSGPGPPGFVNKVSLEHSLTHVLRMGYGATMAGLSRYNQDQAAQRTGALGPFQKPSPDL